MIVQMLLCLPKRSTWSIHWDGDAILGDRIHKHIPIRLKVGKLIGYGQVIQNTQWQESRNQLRGGQEAAGGTCRAAESS